MLLHFFYQEQNWGHYRQKHTISISLFCTYQSGVLCTTGPHTYKRRIYLKKKLIIWLEFFCGSLTLNDKYWREIKSAFNERRLRVL